MPRVAIYTRLSRDPDGNQTATARQERAARAFCEARGWTVATVLEDVDLSAYQRGVHRPAFEELLHLVDSEEVDGTVVWKLDRLTRRPADFERFWAVCEHRGCFLASVTEPIDSSTELGVAIVRILVTFAGLESSTKSIRIKAKMRELAQQGRPPGGPRPYGWTQDRTALVPAEARAIREAADKVLRGASLSAIARHWNTSGSRTQRGVPWGAASIRRALINDRVVGDRTHHGEVVASNCWPPILDRETAGSLRLLLADPRRPTVSDRAAYLLTGLLWCGRCGTGLNGRRTRGRRNYVCPRPPWGCSGIAIGADGTERFLLAEAARRDPPPPKLTAEQLVGRAQALKALNHDFYIRRTLDRPEFVRLRHEIDDIWEALPEPTDDVWGASQQRIWLARRLKRVVVNPGRVGAPFDSSRLDLAWYSEPVRPGAVPVTVGRGGNRRGWLTKNEARHVLCDMGIDRFHQILRDGSLRSYAPTGRRFRSTEVQELLETFRYTPTSRQEITFQRGAEAAPGPSTPAVRARSAD